MTSTLSMLRGPQSLLSAVADSQRDPDQIRAAQDAQRLAAIWAGQLNEAQLDGSMLTLEMLERTGNIACERTGVTAWYSVQLALEHMTRDMPELKQFGGKLAKGRGR